GGTAACSIEHDSEEALVIVSELENGRDGSADEAIAAIRRAVTEAFELRTHAIAIIRAATLAKTPNGKLQRSQCRDEYEPGRLTLLRHGRAEPVAWSARCAAQQR